MITLTNVYLFRYPDAIEVVNLVTCIRTRTRVDYPALALEAFTAVMLQLNVRYKTRVAPRLTGIPEVDPVSGRRISLP